MGTRRLRDVTEREDVDVALMEVSDERRQQAGRRFNVPCFDSMETALEWKPDSLSISTPPHTHAHYVKIALAEGLNFFSEAELFPYPYREVERAAEEKRIVAAPSCTFHFLPMCKELERIVREELGALHAYSYCLSIDLPSWHPGEGYEYYARRRSTNGTREMVVFELNMLTRIFSDPLNVTGTVRRGGELGPHCEDTWCLQMGLENGGSGHLQVLGGSPSSVRKGMAAGAHGTMEFDLAAGVITRRLPKLGIEDTRSLWPMHEVLESVYKEEIYTFVDAVKGIKPWPHSYRRASVMAGVLAAAEQSAVSGRTGKVSPDFRPAQLPDQYER